MSEGGLWYKKKSNKNGMSLAIACATDTELSAVVPIPQDWVRGTFSAKDVFRLITIYKSIQCQEELKNTNDKSMRLWGEFNTHSWVESRVRSTITGKQ